MRRPSGERQMKSVTKLISVPFQANSHGHDPFSRWLAPIDESAARSNSDCRKPFGQVMRATSARVGLAKAEVHDRRGDDLLLDVQAGAHFDLAADAERIDPLIAGGGDRARPNRLPAIRLLALHPHHAGAVTALQPRARGGRRRPDPRRT